MTLGQKIRAGRLGWYCASRHGSMVRISDLPGDHWKIELSPQGQLVPAHKAKRPHRVLDGDADHILDLTALRPLRAVKKYAAVIVNCAGQIVL